MLWHRLACQSLPCCRSPHVAQVLYKTASRFKANQQSTGQAPSEINLMLLQCCRAFVLLSSLLAVVAAVEPDTGVRLPRHLIPRHYTVRLLPHVLDEKENATLDGSVQIDVRCIEDTPQIFLHAVGIRVNLESIKVYDRGSKERFFVQNITEDVDNQFVILHIRRKYLVKGANYVLSMNYIGQLNNQDHPRGFYRLRYTEAGRPSMMALTQMEPIDARKVFPCFDEPDLKADFSITVGRPSHMISVSNMPLYRTLPMYGEGFPGYEWDVFHRSYSMSTYLVSVAILDSASWLSMSDGNVKLRLWARPSLLNQTRHSLKVARKMLDFYQNYLALDFPLPKQDIVAVPNIETAMENWGLIISGEQFLTQEEGVTSEAKKEINTLVMAHEMAHQWFGNLVTLNWWTDIWLNEGLATYLSYVAVDQVYPDYKMIEKFVLNEMQKVMYDDALLTSHPVYRTNNQTEEITSVFDVISYKKGASILRMLNEIIGHKTFKQGLTRYLKTLEYRNAVQNDLWLAFTRQAVINKVKLPYDIKTIMETWTHNVGYPVVMIARNYSARTATAAQSRFLLYQDKNSSIIEDGEGNLWIIPLTYTTASSTKQETNLRWLPQLSQAEKIADFNVPADQWVIFNVNRTGFYRVNYDERNWNLIWAQLLHDPRQIPTISRAQIIDDAFHLARADLLPYQMAFNLANYLKKETDYLPWKSAFEAFNYIDIMLTHMPTTHEAFKQFVNGILTPLYQQMKVLGSNNKDPVALQLYSEATKWACHWDQTDCVEYALSVYRNWMSQLDDSAVIVPADLKRVITCTAIRHLNLSEWQFAWKKFQESNIHSEKDDLLAGMACTTNTSLLSTMLQWTLGNSSHRLDSIHFLDVIKSIASETLTGRDLAFEFLGSHWDLLKFRYNDRPDSALEMAASSFNNLSDLEKLDAFNSKHGEGDLISYLYSVTEANIQWVSKHHQAIDEWLHQLRV